MGRTLLKYVGEAIRSRCQILLLLLHYPKNNLRVHVLRPAIRAPDLRDTYPAVHEHLHACVPNILQARPQHLREPSRDLQRVQRQSLLHPDFVLHRVDRVTGAQISNWVVLLHSSPPPDCFQPAHHLLLQHPHRHTRHDNVIQANQGQMQ